MCWKGGAGWEQKTLGHSVTGKDASNRAPPPGGTQKTHRSSGEGRVPRAQARAILGVRLPGVGIGAGSPAPPPTLQDLKPLSSSGPQFTYLQGRSCSSPRMYIVVTWETFKSTPGPSKEELIKGSVHTREYHLVMERNELRPQKDMKKPYRHLTK